MPSDTSSLSPPTTTTTTTTTITDPVTVTDVDDPSHPLFHHRRTVTDFHYGSVLGEGSYSTVLVGRDKRSNKFYAIKKLDKAHIVKNDKVKYVMIERDALSKMNHPGIIKLYWTFKDHRSLYFVLDLAKNGELYSYIRRLAPFDIDTARFYAAEIISALEHIHSKDVIHRDIKPENILLDERMHIKITDFGSAKIGTDATEPAKANARSFVGTAEYVSPELLCSDPVAKEADLWAFACVLFQMLSGRSPFKAPTDYLIFQNIKGLDYTFPPDFPQSACDLIQKLLVLDPTQRLGSAATGGMEAIRQHPFFNGIEWDRLFDMPAPPLKERMEKEMTRQETAQASKPSEDWFGETGDPFEDTACLDLERDRSLAVSRKEGVTTREDGEETFYRPPSSPPLVVISVSRHEETRRGRPSARSSSSGSHSPERIGGQSHPPWIPHLYPNESILRAGKIIRRPGFFSKKRYLILTNRPRLLYMDEGKEPDGSGGNLRCEIGWTCQLLPELKGKTVFCIHTPHKSYTFEDPEGQAQEWVHTINSMLVDSFGLAS